MHLVEMLLVVVYVREKRQFLCYWEFKFRKKCCHKSNTNFLNP